MGIHRLLSKVMDEMSLKDLLALKASWERRLEAAKKSGDFSAVGVCERMIRLQEERIEAKERGAGDGDDHRV